MDLRPELMPPPLDEAKVARLAALADQLDGCNPAHHDCQKLLAAFNREAGTALTLADFHISGATDAATFVRGVLVPRPGRVPDITYEELLELVTRVCEAQGSPHEQHYWLELLEVNVPDPNLSDLIYWPGEYFGDGDNSRAMSPREILDTTLAWPARFKDTP